MKKFFFIFFTFFFTGCFTPQTPKWYINTPKDNAIYFYASADGYSKQNAVKNALNDIASRINVKISSNFVINKGIHNQKTYNEIYQQINTTVADISFNNYEILKTDRQDEKYYVLLRVNKQKLINSLKTKINMEINKIKIINLNNENTIINIINSYGILYKTKNLKSKIFILESLGSDISDYINNLEIIEKKALQTIQNTPFKIKTNLFKEETIECFSKYIYINSSKNSIKIKIIIQKYNLFDSYIIKGKALIYLDKPYTVTFLGKSVSSYKEAENFAKNEYKKRLSKLLKTIFKISVF